MYAFNSRREGSLTCRHRLLDLAGYQNNQCRYTHTISGAISPPSMFVCYAFNNGGCRLSQDQCLFAHLITGRESQYLQIRHPELSSRDTRIAEAAAKTGFDCSNWGKLKCLIDAVRAVNTAVSYPDRWTGPAAFQSSIYPDRWSAESIRLRKGVVRAYQDADRTVSVPAFVVPASQILRNMNGPPRVRGTPAVSFAAGTGSNRMSLGPRSNKRTGDELIDLGSSSPKRAKTEAPATPAISGSSQSNCIDLTQDDKPVTYVPTRRQPTRPALANISNNATGGNRASKKQVVRRQRVTHERMVHRETTGVLAKIASKLRASVHALNVDKETLRARWKVDNYLQPQHITDHLAELNESFYESRG